MTISTIVEGAPGAARHWSIDLLDGLLPEELIAHTEMMFVDEELGLCQRCWAGGKISCMSVQVELRPDRYDEDGDVTDLGTGYKTCPILFADLLFKKLGITVPISTTD
jgi:hypothetical protein